MLITNLANLYILELHRHKHAELGYRYLKICYDSMLWFLVLTSECLWGFCMCRDIVRVWDRQTRGFVGWTRDRQKHWRRCWQWASWNFGRGIATGQDPRLRSVSAMSDVCLFNLCFVDKCIWYCRLMPQRDDRSCMTNQQFIDPRWHALLNFWTLLKLKLVYITRGGESALSCTRYRRPHAAKCQVMYWNAGSTHTDSPQLWWMTQALYTQFISTEGAHRAPVL